MKKYKKAIAIILVVLMISAIFTACSQGTVETNQTETESKTVTTTVLEESKTEKETAKSESTAKKSDDSDTTTKPAEQKSAGQTTTKKVTTTQKSTTTERQTTTKKVTTTQKLTTTKKVATTEDDWNCSVDGHSWETGPIGWCNSYDEAERKAKDYIAQNADDGGYRIRECYYCGKFTAKITLD